MDVPRRGDSVPRGGVAITGGPQYATVTNARLSGCSASSIERGATETDYREGAEPAVPQISMLSGAMTLLKCNWGIGMMTMPYMVQQGGLAGGIVLFSLSMALTQFSIQRLIQCKEKVENGGERHALVGFEQDLDTPPHDYTSLMATVLGTRAEYTAIASIAISMFGSCIAYLKFLSDNLPEFVGLNGATWIGISLVPIVFLSWFDTLKFLQPFVWVGALCAISFVGILIADTANNVSPDEFRDYFENATQLDWTNIPQTLSIAVFCNEGVVVVAPSVHTALAQPDRMSMVTAVTVIVFTCLYMAVAVAGDVRFRNIKVNAEVSKDMNPRSYVDSAAVVLYSIQLIPTFGIVYYCGYEALEGKFCRVRGVDRGGQEWQEQYKKRAVFLRVVGVACAAFLSIAITNFADALGLVGALGTSSAVFILPHLAWLRLNYEERTLLEKIPSYFLVLFGISVAVLGTVQCAYKLAGA